jgi:hypothetical protein
MARRLRPRISVAGISAVSCGTNARGAPDVAALIRLHAALSCKLAPRPEGLASACCIRRCIWLDAAKGRQGAPVLEHCRKPALWARSRGAASGLATTANLLAVWNSGVATTLLAALPVKFDGRSRVQSSRRADSDEAGQAICRPRFLFGVGHLAEFPAGRGDRGRHRAPRGTGPPGWGSNMR